MRATTYTVYWDLLFIINAAFDLLILWLVSKSGGERFYPVRAIGAAILGGLYGVGLLFPVLSSLYTLPIILLLPALLLIISAPQPNVKRLLYHLVSFYVLAFALSGLVNALQTLALKLHLPTNSVWLLIAALVMAICTGQKLSKILRQRPANGLCEIELQYAGQAVRLKALIDTGNLLTDPLSGLPAVVLDAKAAVLLHPALADLPSLSLPSQELFLQLCANGKTDFRLLPYRTIDKTDGLLLAFGPVNITADNIQTEVFAALAPQPLGSRCQAIIPGTITNQKQSKGDVR